MPVARNPMGILPPSLKGTVHQWVNGAIRAGRVRVQPRFPPVRWHRRHPLKRRFKLNGRTIGEPIDDPTDLAAGSPAIVPVVQGEGFYGTSDFEDTEQYVAELHGRESRVAAALNKHANPHLAVPEGVMQTRPDGSIVIDARGMAIPTVNRIRSMRASLTDGIRFTIAGQADLIAASGGERYLIDPDKISLRWPPELSAGLGDEAEAITMLVEAGLLERETAIQMISKVRRSEAEEIAQRNPTDDKSSQA